MVFTVSVCYTDYSETKKQARRKNMTFGEKLSKLRRDAGYTQEQLAELLGVSRQSVSKWESDIAYPETDKLVKKG